MIRMVGLSSVAHWYGLMVHRHVYSDAGIVLYGVLPM